ncbi:MAG: hypothetical protein JNJ54_03855 [Myxococcaceae bacterium]|nr:hypothetical protein [Myxococcaceae bacterium]
MPLMLALLLTATPSSEWKTLGLSTGLQRMLDHGDYGLTPRGFRAIALSHVADGCVWQAQQHPERTDAARACVGRAFERWQDLAPKSCPRVDGVRRCDADALLTTENPLALAHLVLVMGAADVLGPCADPLLHERLAAGLEAASTADPFAHVPSYRAFPLRWPADQSALIAALHRADVAHGTQTHTGPLEAFTTYLDEKGLHPSGLPKSEVTGKGPGAKYPRGCAQAFISRYLAEVDPVRTAAWWKTYRAQYLVRLPFGVIGFREWPPGIDRSGDVDSGPIVLGIGVAASALGISAARAQGEEALAKELEASADQVISFGVGLGIEKQAFAQAIRFEARWHPVSASAN